MFLLGGGGSRGEYSLCMQSLLLCDITYYGGATRFSRRQRLFLLLYIFNTISRYPNAKSCLGCYALLSKSN